MYTAVECTTTKFRRARAGKKVPRAKKKKTTVFTRPTRGGVEGSSVCDKPKFSNTRLCLDGELCLEYTKFSSV
jgi:hypothetical protein